MKVLIDLNLPPAWVSELEKHGIDAVHWSTIGDARAPDREIFDWARKQSCVILTHDLDFGALLAMTRTDGPSVIQIRTQDVMPASLAGVVHGLLREHAGALERGAIVSVDEAAARVRILPLVPPPAGGR